MADDSPPSLSPRTRRILEAPVAPTLLRLSLPNLGEAAARIAFISFDAIFVGWLGTDALAGVSLAFPLFLLMQMTSASGVGAGVNGGIARAMGAGRPADAAAIACHAVLLALLFGGAFSLAMLTLGPWLYAAMGATGASLAAAVEYSAIVFGGIVAVWLMNLLANVVRGTGNMLVPAMAIILGEAVHLALSPVLILGLGPMPSLGVAGAAIAVVASYATGALVLAFHLLAGRGEIRLRPCRPQARHFAAILGVGIPAGLNVVQAQATMILTTGFAAAFGTTALAGYGAAARLDLLQVPLTFAIGSAVIAMVATALGAGRLDRARHIAWTGAGIGLAIGLLFAAVALGAPRTWMGLFSDDPATIAEGAAYLRRAGIAYPILGIGFGLFFSLLGLGRAAAPFLAGTARLAVVAGGGWAAVHWLGGGLPMLATVAVTAAVAFTAAMLLVAAATRELRG
ncbi:MATE family efflux transporter [Allostella sp. ATCC 35155]|nr:MATE family efflux transporter [Stella sp. ATCC 35155]